MIAALIAALALGSPQPQSCLKDQGSVDAKGILHCPMGHQDLTVDEFERSGSQIEPLLTVSVWILAEVFSNDPGNTRARVFTTAEACAKAESHLRGFDEHGHFECTEVSVEDQP